MINKFRDTCLPPSSQYRGTGLLYAGTIIRQSEVNESSFIYWVFHTPSLLFKGLSIGNVNAWKCQLKSLIYVPLINH